MHKPLEHTSYKIRIPLSATSCLNIVQGEPRDSLLMVKVEPTLQYKFHWAWLTDFGHCLKIAIFICVNLISSFCSSRGSGQAVHALAATTAPLCSNKDPSFIQLYQVTVPRQIQHISHASGIELCAQARLPKPWCDRSTDYRQRFKHFINMVVVREVRRVWVSIQIGGRQSSLGVWRIGDGYIRACRKCQQRLQRFLKPRAWPFSKPRTWD